MFIPAVGDRVIDSDGNIGYVTDNQDPHEIEIQYDEDGEYGYYCHVETCYHYEQLELY